MAKAKTVWYCTNCGNEYPQFLGKCPACGEWNTMKEMTVEPRNDSAAKGAKGVARRDERKPLRLREIDYSREERVSLGMPEVDRLLGGGIVPGSLVLVGGGVVTQEWADEIKADGYGQDAIATVELAKKLLHIA